MLKKIKTIAAALPLILLAATPAAQANSQQGGILSNPDGEGGCYSALYQEDAPSSSYDNWEVPALGNGQSATVYSSNFNWQTGVTHYQNSFAVTFTCTNGNLSSDYVSYGIWYY